MAIFLVNFENLTDPEDLFGLESLSGADRLVIFYGSHCDKLTFETHRKLCVCRADVLLVDATISSKDSPVTSALDLQLSMYAGFLMGQNPDEGIYIISKKKDFYASLLSFRQVMQSEHVTFTMSDSFLSAFSTQTYPHPEELRAQVAELLGVDPQDAKETKKLQRISAILRCSEDLASLHESLKKYVGLVITVKNEDELEELYLKLKPRFFDLRNTIL